MPRNHQIFLLSIFLVLPFATIVRGQSIHARPYFEQDGIPSNIVSDIEQSDDNHLWVLTSRGLAEYDGSTWTQHFDTIALPSKFGSLLETMPNGNLVAAGFSNTGLKIIRFNGGEAFSYPISPNVLELDSYFEYIDIITLPGENPEAYFVGIAENNLCQLNLETQEWHQFALPIIKGTSVLGAGFWHGKLALKTTQGIYTQNDRGRWEPRPLPNFPSPSILHWERIKDTNDTLYIGSNWVVHYAENQVKRIWQFPTDDFHASSDFEVGPSGRIIFNSRQNFFVFDPISGEIISFLTDYKNAAPNYSQLHVDHESNLWIATYRGLYKVNSFRFFNFFQRSELRNEEGTCILELQPNTLFLGHTQSYSILSQNRIVNYPNLDISPSVRNRFYDIVKHPRQDTWYIAGGSMGLGRLDDNYRLTWSPSKTNRSINAVSFVQDTLVVADDHQTNWLLNGRTVKTINQHFFVRKIYSARSGRLLFCSDHGFFESLGSELIPIPLKGSSIRTNTFDILEFEDRVLVASEHGLLELVEDTLLPAEVFNYKEDRPIYDLMATQNGNLWVGTDDGVYILSPNHAPIHYSVRDGLSGSEVNRNSLLEDGEGNIWIGTNSGISRYMPLLDPMKNWSPKPELIMAWSNEAPIDPTTKTRLSPAENTLEFQFGGLSFYHEEETNYRIRLHGFDNTWRYHSAGQTKQLYTNLPPGQSYQFEIQARLSSGTWSESVISEAIYIRRPFYATIWFFALLLISALGLGFLVRTWIQSQRNQRWLAQEVSEKTQELLLNQKKLQAQNDNLTKINQELDRFVYSASHDLSAPLKSIAGLLHIAKLDKYAGRLQQEQYLSMIEKSVGQMEKFIRELIDFSRNSRTESKISEISLPKLIPELLENLQFMDHFVRVNFKMEWGKDARLIMSDEFRLQVVINNLLSNAIKFQRHDIDQPLIMVQSKKVDGGWTITIADNGVGIGETFQERIFDMFFRATENIPGSGLGLYIAREAVHKMGGEITLTSQPNDGAIFKVFLPEP